MQPPHPPHTLWGTEDDDEDDEPRPASRPGLSAAKSFGGPPLPPSTTLGPSTPPIVGKSLPIAKAGSGTLGPNLPPPPPSKAGGSAPVLPVASASGNSSSAGKASGVIAKTPGPPRHVARAVYRGGPVEGLPDVNDTHIAQAFREIDFDSNGFIGVSELRFLLSAMGERPTDEELDEMIRIVDTRGDGQISYEDFLQLFSPGNAVLLEMISTLPAREEEEESVPPIVEKKNQPLSLEQQQLAQASIEAIRHSFLANKQKKEALQNPPARRAAPPLPVSRRQARAERDMLAAMRNPHAKAKPTAFPGYRQMAKLPAKDKHGK